MYTGRFESERKAPARHAGKRTSKRPTGRLAAMALATVLLLALTIGGTVAWLTSKTDNITNTFTPSKVTCKVEESFDGRVKTNVNVKNTGDTTAFIRVKLVTYRTNDNGDHIGGTAQLPTFDLGQNWVKYGDYYYYTLPVDPGATPASNLTDEIVLTATYDDADGGHQSIDVMAEAIQSEPAQAVGQTWGVSISQGSVTAYSGT